MIINAPRQTLGVVQLVDSSGVRSMRWVVGVGAAGNVEGLLVMSGRGSAPRGLLSMSGRVELGIWAGTF